jgi:hypothetical protein
MIPRLGRRSTSAPAGSATTANARGAAAESRPTCNVLAASRTTAVSGSASWVTAEPISLTVCLPHSSRKSRCRQSPPADSLSAAGSSSVTPG